MGPTLKLEASVFSGQTKCGRSGLTWVTLQVQQEPSTGRYHTARCGKMMFTGSLCSLSAGISLEELISCKTESNIPFTDGGLARNSSGGYTPSSMPSQH